MANIEYTDGNIVRGDGDNDDYPNGLPMGSKYRGTLICGATTLENKPCMRPPNDTGRCPLHNAGNPRKSPDKSPYKHLFTPDECKSIKNIKVGSLIDEIILFKMVLRRKVANPDISGRELSAIGHTIKELEEAHFALAGGEIVGNPYDVVIALRKCVSDLDASVSADIPEEDNGHEPKTISV
jgi:hypothetical protein